MPKKKSPQDKTVFTRAAEVIDEIDRLTTQRKALYERHDELAVQLENESAEALSKYGLVLERPFDKGNTQWGHAPVRRLKIARVKLKKID